MGPRIDLNADVAESFGRWRLGDDEALLPLLTSANVACGFHAGDARTIRGTVAACADLGVVVGAQVSYRDLAGFGRRAMEVDPADLEADVLYQIAAVDGLARTAGVRARYVKPHGALYHRVLDDEGQAAALVAAVLAWDPSAYVLTQPVAGWPRWRRTPGSPSSARPSPTAGTATTAGCCRAPRPARC